MTLSYLKYIATLLFMFACVEVNSQVVYVWDYEQPYYTPSIGCCPPRQYGCPGPQCPPTRGTPQQPYGGYTPEAPYRPNPPQSVPTNPKPTPPESVPVPAKPQIAFDWDEYDKRQAKLLEAIKNNKCDCRPTDLTAINNKLDLVLAAVAKNQPASPPANTDEIHVVVVADHNSPYWQRLSDALVVARKTFSGIQDTILPDFPIGVHPQAVVYKNSVPVRVVKGQYDVENLLSRLARGESI